MRCELSDYEWTAIKPMLSNKPRSVRRVNDRRVLNGIFWVLRSGAPWRDLPENYGPYRYSITLSARNTSPAGISWPSAFAVLRLMASSNFEGCSTGRSVGLTPRSILTTCRAR